MAGASFQLRSSAVPPRAVVVGFRGVEEISRTYAFDVYFTLSQSAAELALGGSLAHFVDMRDAVYSKIALRIDLGEGLEPFVFAGVVASLELVRALRESALYRVRIVPQLWQLSLTRHSRVFTKKSIVEIIQEVLEEGGVTDVELRLENPYAPEAHVCQYRESNLAFIERWMEREGISYFFEHDEAGERLVLTDARVSRVTRRASPVRYHPVSSSGDVSAKNAFDNFTCTHAARPASVKLTDYDYAKPMLHISGSAPVSHAGLGEIVEHGGRMFSLGEAQRLANVRAEELRASDTVYHVTGAASHLYAGHTFDVEEHPNPPFNRTYLATALRHFGFEPSFATAWGSLVKPDYPDLYRVEVTAIESDTPFRPERRTPWPRIDGYENAIVDGSTTSQYAQIDEQGRYAVKFKFDEGSLRDGKASTFVRMVQPHDGPQEGQHFPLRKGVEVLCAFQGGDPDCPVILGSVHNAVNPSVVTSSNHTQNVIRSGSLNHIVMEDTAGAMYLEAYCPIATTKMFLGAGDWNFNLTTMGTGQIHTESNLNVDVNGEMKVDVASSVDVDYHANLDWDVFGAVNTHYHATLGLHVDGAARLHFDSTHHQHVAGAATEKYDATLGLAVTGNATHTYAANHASTIAGSRSALVVGTDATVVNANHETVVLGDQQTVVLGAQTHAVMGSRTEAIVGSHTLDILGDQTITIAGAQTIHVNAPQSWLRKADSSHVTYGATAEAFLGAKATLNAGAFANMTLGAQLDVFGGVKLSLAAALQLAMSAVNINVVAGANMGLTAVNMSLTGISLSYSGIDISGSGLHLDI
ncbi:MAG: type VI secretion system tip protein TssI/VgrG [Polyangiaceae bacterium]